MDYAKAASGPVFLKNKLQSLVKKTRAKMKMRSHRTYIVPTGFGFAFGGICFVLLIMAIGYSNNLLYFFVFLLISMGFTGMWATNKNVEKLKVLKVQFASLHAGEENVLGYTLQNQNLKSNLWNIELRFAQANEAKETLMVDEVQFEKNVQLRWVPPRRGRYAIPRLLIQSRFPFGMLRSWKYFDETHEHYIYPQRRGTVRLPQPENGANEAEDNARVEDQGLFRDFREFQKSDPPQRIDWRRSLKHQKHLVKNFENAGEKKVLLDWRATGFLTDFEERVSQLALWIDVCHRRHDLYSLKIGDESTPFAATPAHLHQCLQRLTVLQPSDVA